MKKLKEFTYCDKYASHKDLIDFLNRKDLKILHIESNYDMTTYLILYKERLLWKLFKRKGKKEGDK